MAKGLKRCNHVTFYATLSVLGFIPLPVRIVKNLVVQLDVHFKEQPRCGMEGISEGGRTGNRVFQQPSHDY